MRYRLFQYPLPADPELPDLNAFLADHRTTTVNQQVVNTAGGAMLVFVVELASSAKGQSLATGMKSRIDYREVLSDQEFQIYDQLRQCRKELAAAEGVAVYRVFSNAQLAEMVQNQLTTSEEIARIQGVGQARAEKYEQVLTILRASFGSKEASESGGDS